MGQPTLEDVKKLFKDNEWDVDVQYGSSYISLGATKVIETSATTNTGEVFSAEFAYRKQDLVYAPVLLDENKKNIHLIDIMDYRNGWGDKVKYSGTPAAVQLYERTFGASSIANKQVYSGTGKSLAAVEAAFKAEGYLVDLNVSDKGTDIETWQINCIKASPYEALTIGYGYSAEWARELGELNSTAAAAGYSTTVKCEGNFFYYGTPGAENLFQCVGADGSVNKAAVAATPQTANTTVANTTATGEKPQPVAAIENAFMADGYSTVMATPSNKGTDKETWQLTFVKVSPYEMLIIGYGYSADWAKTEGKIYTASAEAYNSTVKYKNNAFYYGTPGAEQFFESITF